VTFERNLLFRKVETLQSALNVMSLKGIEPKEVSGEEQPTEELGNSPNGGEKSGDDPTLLDEG